MCRSDCVLSSFMPTSKLIYGEFRFQEYFHHAISACNQDGNKALGKFLWDLWL